MIILRNLLTVLENIHHGLSLKPFNMSHLETIVYALMQKIEKIPMNNIEILPFLEHCCAVFHYILKRLIPC